MVLINQTEDINLRGKEYQICPQGGQGKSARRQLGEMKLRKIKERS